LADIAIGGTPSRDNPRYWAIEGAEGFPWVAISDLHGRVIRNTKEQITAAGVANSNVKPVAPGTVLMSFKLSLGRMAFAGTDLFTNEAIAAFKSREEIDEEYLYYVLPDAVRSAATDVAIKGATLNKKSLAALQISYPALNAQKAIARVLASIDTAIEKTEALIAKHQQIKAGLMHDLFTRGVLPKGQLRPPRSEAPELYQETAIGWIPRDWTLSRCIDLCSRICVGIVIQPTQYYVEAGIPALRSANVREEGIDPSNFVYITASSNQQLAKSQLKAGDIVSVRTGYPGTSAVVPDELEGANCIDILISTPSEKVSSDFLCDWINSSFGKEQVLRQQGGMAQQHFNVGEMRELLVALPTLAEQNRIREKLSVITQRLMVERARAEKYRSQKLGLMQDLLTGKVAVKVDGQTSATSDRALEQKVLARMGERAQAVEVDIDAI
jgi:type I restriction enzyme S subunit